MGCEYSLSPNGRRTGVHEERKEADNSYSTTDISYSYDKLNRLVSESSVSSTQADRSFNHSYVYDLNGNRLKKDTGNETIEYVYNQNDQLETETSNVNGGTAYVYNDNGSLISKISPKATNTYTYNLQNRLSTASIDRIEGTSNVEISSNYEYNLGGIRVKSSSTTTVNAGTPVNKNRIFLLDSGFTGYAQVMEEFETIGGNPVKSYVLGDDVLSQSVNGAVNHLLYDGHGSTRLLADASGNVGHRYDFDAYGKMLGGNPNVSNPSATDMLYSGEQFDTDLQMQNLRARYYDQDCGRFNRVDDYAGNKYDPQSLHKYAYAHADPVNGIDPSGKYIGILILIAATVIILSAYVAFRSMGKKSQIPVKADLIITSRSFIKEIPEASHSLDGYGDVYIVDNLKQLFETIIEYSEKRSPNKRFSVKIVEHGNSGAQKFAGGQVEANDFASNDPRYYYFNIIQKGKIKDKLSLLIFAGCNVGEGIQGDSFLRTVSKELNTNTASFTADHHYGYWGGKHRVTKGGRWKLFSPSVGKIRNNASREELEQYRAYP